jgi:hypothetical protein
MSGLQDTFVVDRGGRWLSRSCTALRNQRDLQAAIRFFDSKRPGGYVR